MNARMKMMGYNSAKELERRILKSMNMEIPDELQEEEGRDTF
jgi:hypothetical protein